MWDNVVDVSGLRPACVLAALWNRLNERRVGMLDYLAEPMEEELAQEWIDHGKGAKYYHDDFVEECSRLDYVGMIPVKGFISADKLIASGYGDIQTMREVVAKLRESGECNCVPGAEGQDEADDLRGDSPD